MPFPGSVCALNATTLANTKARKVTTSGEVAELLGNSRGQSGGMQEITHPTLRFFSRSVLQLETLVLLACQHPFLHRRLCWGSDIRGSSQRQAGSSPNTSWSRSLHMMAGPCED